MRFGKKLKSKSLNNGKLVIYQMPLFDRIVGIWSVIMFTGLAVFGLITGYERKNSIIILLVMIAYGIAMFFNVFKTYICLDIQNNKLIIREDPGFKKEEISLGLIKDIEISNDVRRKEFFTIDIKYHTGFTKRIASWTPTGYNISMFAGYKRQTKRLKKFILKCKPYLNNELSDKMRV